MLGNYKNYSSLSSQEIKDGVFLDCVGLTFPDGKNGSTLDKLRERGLYINAVDKGSREDFNVNTNESNYELQTLADLDISGFHARSYAVFPIKENLKSQTPTTLRVAFGGTRKLPDAPRTAAMFITKRPFAYEKQTKEFIEKTFQQYEKKHGEKTLPNNIIVSAHSAGTTHAIEAYNILKTTLKEKGISAKAHLRLYEPFDVRSTGFKPEEGESVVSFVSQNSFLPKIPYYGETIGHKEVLPPSSRKKLLDGTLIGLAEKALSSSLMAHTLLWMVDSNLDKNLGTTINKMDSLESLLSLSTSCQSLSGMTR
jgi:hypothetical protein